jgi:hypothetical protein
MRPWKWELWPWNWRKVRKARISKEDRDLFERYGESVIGSVLAGDIPIVSELRAVLPHSPPGQPTVTLDKFEEARNWLTECRDSQHRREQRLETIEIGVVALITVEILLSIIFGAIGIYEGVKQGKVLDGMARSMADSAATIQTVRDELKSLAADQAKTREILQQQEADRLAQAAKKPKLVLYLEDIPLKAGTHFTPRKETETSVTFDLDLTNNGNATATDVLFHVSVSAKEVFVDPPFTEVPLPSDQTMRTFQAPSNLPIRPQSHARVTMTLHYPKGHAPFDVVFLAETNDQPPAPLGSLRVTPQKSPN